MSLEGEYDLDYHEWDELDQALLEEFNGEEREPMVRREAVYGTNAIVEVMGMPSQQEPSPMDVDSDSDQRLRAPGPFRMHAKKLALTYPQCELAPGIALARILVKWGVNNIKWVVVGQEKHRDGNHHLHAAIWLKTAFDTTSPSSLDFIGGQHGSYETMRDPAAWVKYCIKDGNWVASEGFDPEAYITSRKKRSAVSFETVAKKIKGGKTVKEVNDAHPGFILQHLAKVRVYETFVRAVTREVPEQWPSEPSREVRKEWFHAEEYIYNWLRLNVITGTVREFKQ